MTSAVSIAPERTIPTTETWTIDPAHTHVQFAVRHLMISTVKGRFAGVTGSVALDPSRPREPAVEISIDAASIDTREEKRDAHLRSADFLATDTFPSISFIGRRIEGDINGQFTLIGDLTIRNATHEITLDVRNSGRARDPWGGDRMGLTATGRLNRLDYGLKWNVALETGGVLVGEQVTIAIDVQLVRQV